MQISTEVRFPRNGIANPRNFNQIEREFEQAKREATEEGTLLVLGDLKKYPRQRAGTKYRRTKVLARSWHHRVFNRPVGVLGGVVSSGQIAPYNRFVQSGRFQARQHRRFWRNTDEAVVKKRRPQIYQIYIDKITPVLNRK